VRRSHLQRESSMIAMRTQILTVSSLACYRLIDLLSRLELPPSVWILYSVSVTICYVLTVSRVSNAIDQQGSLVETPPDGLILHDPAITRLKATPMDDADLRCMSPQYNSSANIYNNKSSEDDQQTDDELKITSDQTFGENLARNQSPDSSNGQIDHLETTKNSIPARTLI